MRKLSKKQNLIILVALFTVVVIIALIVGANVIKTNITNSSYNSANNNSSSSNLLPEYIKEGITIGGITGTLIDLDTSDATANAEDIIWGETAYVKGEKITGTKVVTVAHGKASQKTFEENTVLIDDYGNRVKVPVGFKIAEDSATSVTGGVVIEDVTAGDNNTKGSQFVWVPVGDVLTDNNGSKTTITLGRYTFAEDGTETLVQSAENYEDESQLKTSSSGYYQELLKTTTSKNTKAKDIESFITKSLSSGGYYIGRYEAGDATATNSARTSSTSDTNPIVSKAGVYPYTYITQPQASSLCQRMYSNSYFESDLINSYAWDTATVFIQKFSEDKDYSRQGGKNTKAALQKCGASILNEVDSGDKVQDVRCNIYDMAGNSEEWSTETYSDSDSPWVSRGGWYNTSNYTSTRSIYNTTNSGKDISCRTTLYL